ncbi:MAG: RES family NAD+ phosphorylase [Magnetococcales bacterium]|nr:RES family NAD+ phosphorylase [Magnetococcales bacterium]
MGFVGRKESRFSDGSYGIYYAGKEQETAIREVAHHRSQFCAATQDPPHAADFITLIGSVESLLHDIRIGYDHLHDPNSYTESRMVGRQLRDRESNGLVYRSVQWNGSHVDRYFIFNDSGEWKLL